MRGIIGTSIRFRFLIIILAAVLMVFGITQLGFMPVDALPEFSPPRVEIQTEAVGLSAEEVEQLITVPLEQNLLNGVAWLDKIRSESISGLSSITLLFEAGTDINRARQMVAERLAQAPVALPRVSKGPVMLQPTSATSRVLVVGLSSKKLSAIQMSVLARWTIAPRLMGVPGVANVATWGMRDRQLQVQVDPERLSAYNVSLLQLIEAVGNALWASNLSFVEASTPGKAGFIDTPQQRLGIQHVSPIVSPETLSQVTMPGRGMLLINEAEVDLSNIAMKQGAVHVGDVADVVENHQPLIGDARIGDAPIREAANLLLVIEKSPGSDTVKVTQELEKALAALRPGLGDMEIDSSLVRPATFVAAAKDNLMGAVVAMCVIIVLVVGVIFFNWRIALISLISVALSLTAAALVLYGRGATLNMFVVLGLVVAIGLIVADVIIDYENVFRRLQRLQKEKMPQPPATVILDSLRETRGAMLFATLICLLGVLPVLALQEGLGVFFQALAVSYALAVLASTLVALIVTPALFVLLFGGASKAPVNRAPSRMTRWLQARYDRLLDWAISKPRIAYVMIGILAVIGLGALPFLHPALLPTFKEPEIMVQVEAAAGASHPEMVRLVDRMIDDLGAIAGVRKVGALIGRAEFGDRVVDINSAQILINIAPTADYGATVNAIDATISAYPGVKSELQTHLNQTTSQAVAQADAPVIVRLYGQDWTILHDKSMELRQMLSGITGVADLRTDLPGEQPTLEVEVNMLDAQRHGINPGDVRRAASTLVNGLQVGSLYREQKVFDVVVWSIPKTRGNLTDIRKLLLDSPFFKVPVRLEDVAEVRIAPHPNVIRHEDVSRYMDIGVNVKGRDARAVAAEIQNRLRQVQFPLEYHAEVTGAYEQQQAAQNRLIALAAVALIGTLLLLQAAFESWRLAIVSLLTLPLALVGGLVALAAVDARTVSLSVAFGLLTVFGIAARNQIMLIRHLQQLQVRQVEAHQQQPPSRKRVQAGARESFASAWVAALALGLAMAPLILMGDIPGLEILRPTAIVILGGMVTCAIVDVFVAPALYVRLVGGEAHSGTQ